MKRIYMVLLVAIVGFGAAIFSVLFLQPVNLKSRSNDEFMPPYLANVVGAGIVEASSGNIVVGTPVSGVVTKIFVKTGDSVKIGDPLFLVDDQSLRAQLVTARVRVKEAAASLLKPKHRLERAEQLARRDPAVISAQDLESLRDDVAQGQTAVMLAEAQLKQIQMEIEHHTVRALVSGKVLQLRIRPGEFAEATSLAPPLLLLGRTTRMNVRIDIDESDAWRFRQDAEVTAISRGHPQLKISLRYEYTEPYIVPKTSLTGQGTERIDRRVLQVIYSFAPEGLPVYPGQQLDIYINTTANDQKTTRP